MQVVKDIHDMFRMHNLNSDVIEGLIKHDATTNALDVFKKDFYSLVGEGNIMEKL